MSVSLTLCLPRVREYIEIIISLGEDTRTLIFGDRELRDGIANNERKKKKRNGSRLKTDAD